MEIAPQDWKKTACILCSENCGLEVLVEDGHITRVRGDKAHPSSKGYLCQKAQRLDYYQNNSERLSHPLRRKDDGTFEEISWDTAIREVAAKLVELRDTYTGDSLAFYGGGGQGNHLNGSYGAAVRTAMQTRYLYSSLAQEKTGDFWVNGRLFGRQSCHVSCDVENADFILFIGTNPWNSHGFPRARKVLQEIHRDPNRTMVVIDPKRTKTAELADHFFQVRPGADAFLLAAMAAVIVQEDLIDSHFIETHTVDFDVLRAELEAISIDAFADTAGVDAESVRTVARGYAAAGHAVIRADLGIEQSFHSTLNSYLEKILFLMTGHFAKKGCNNLHSQFVPLIGHSDEHGPDAEKWKTKVQGVDAISKIFPPNILPAEINTDHPERIRGLFVDSSNPVVSAADTHAYREAFKKLELLVVIDVVMTETAELAHYVLPASSQFEKWEATFFTFGFPTNHFHLREPLFEPREGTLTEPVIYQRLAQAMGETEKTSPLLGGLAQAETMPEFKVLPAELKHAAAALYMASQRYAQRYDVAVKRAVKSNGSSATGSDLFQEIMTKRSGVELSTHTYEEVFDFIHHDDRKIHFDIPTMLEELNALTDEAANPGPTDPDFPFILSAGERRAYNANTIFRDPAWRKSDPDGALHIHPEDAQRIGIENGAQLICETRAGSIQVIAELVDALQPGYITLPHGYGLKHTAANGDRKAHGPHINELTSATHCDPWTKTPYHKTVPARLRKA